LDINGTLPFRIEEETSMSATAARPREATSNPSEYGVVSRTALVVGAGIGGLSAGIALKQAGWTVRIFERATSPRELGFGLGLAPNAITALTALGVADTVIARGFAPTRASAEIRRLDGRLLKRLDLPDVSALGRIVIALRPALHGALLEAVGDCVATGHEATGFSTSGDRVWLQFAGQPPAEGDLLIGADGVSSVIRRQLHPAEGPARSSGLMAVRGAVHGAEDHLDGLAGIYYLGQGVESVIVRASDTGIYWFVSLNRALVPDGLRDPAAVLAHISPRFDGTFRAITAATGDLRFDELFDRDPLPHWGAGPVTLVGDAAHPVLPHTGQGAAQAMVDAVTLGMRMREPVALEPALRAYEDERRGKMATLLGQGRRTAAMMRTMNPVAVAMRDTAIRLMPVTSIVRMTMTINRRAGTDV
jgi:2-polyprenyl-6-methoxyphenol hydroxylase-like FAD-dependent oxidoreductase